jgi:hypothetical protein
MWGCGKYAPGGTTSVVSPKQSQESKFFLDDIDKQQQKQNKSYIWRDFLFLFH